MSKHYGIFGDSRVILFPRTRKFGARKNDIHKAAVIPFEYTK